MIKHLTIYTGLINIIRCLKIKDNFASFEKVVDLLNKILIEAK